MKRIRLYAFLLVLVCTLIFTFTACNGQEDPPSCPPHADANTDGICDSCGESLAPVSAPDISGIKLEDKEVYYNGEKHSLEITGALPEGVTVSYEGNGVSDVGVYTVVAKFYYGGKEMVGKSLGATLEICKSGINMSGVVAEDKSAVYNGAEHKPTLTGTLPPMVDVVYTYTDAQGNSVDKMIASGEYKVTATFVYDENNYIGISPKTFSYTVTRATYDMSGVYLPSVTKTYDGEAVIPAITGKLPDGVSVSYVCKNALGEVVESMVEAGVYTVYASFVGDEDNYYPISPISATVTIEELPAGELRFDDLTVRYDGEEHSILIKGTLPEGVTVVYEGNGATDVGTYEIVAKLYRGDEELTDERMTATLTIIKASFDMSGVTAEDKSGIYTGAAHVPALSGKLPSGVEVVYTCEAADGGAVSSIINAGVYKVTASFVYDEKNYEEIAPMIFTYTVMRATHDMSGITLESVTKTYDGEAVIPEIEGVLPEGVSVSYVYKNSLGNIVESIVDAGVYTVEAIFTVDEVNYYPVSSLTATVTVEEIPVGEIVFKDKTVKYNGAEHSILVAGDLPSGVSVVYEGNGVTDAGVYTVIAKFYLGGEELTDKRMEATLTVLKADVDTSGITAEDMTSPYTGAAHKPTVKGSIPVGVTVKYTYYDESGTAVGEIVKVGEYVVTATFTVENKNYNEIAPISFGYSVTRLAHDMSGVKLETVVKAYDGKAIAPTVTGTLPEGVGVSYVYKNALGEVVESIKGVGTYTVYASFTVDEECYYPIGAMSATVTVERAVIGGISFADAVFKYDGTVKSIYAQGVPEWVEVSYSGNGVSAPGTYTVTATFTVNDVNYLPIAPMTAKIVIDLGISTDTPTEGIVFEEYEGGYAAAGVSGDVSVLVIPDTYKGKPVLSVKSFAFSGNDKLTYAYIPSSVINIGNKAFADCTSLGLVEFGNVKVIGQQAFKNTAITEIVLPDSLETVGYGAFQDTELKKMTLPFVGGSRGSSNTHLGYIFGATTYSANAARVPNTLTTVVMSNSCTEIPAYAFWGITSINEVVLGHGLKAIGNSAFRDCSALRSIYIPVSVASIPADARADNSPFYGTAEDMMLVVESVDSMGAWGQYFAHISDAKHALVVYGKTYEDYVINKESYREDREDNAKLSGLFVGGSLVSGFDPTVKEYEISVDINIGYLEISAIAGSAGATVTVDPASVANGGVATVTVVSKNGEVAEVYKVKFNLTGTFDVSAEIVNKNGAEGTVSFVIDDGYKPTATWVKSKLQEYANLSVTFAIATKNFATFNTVVNEEGLTEYVFDEDGKYTYTVNQDNVDFWRDVLSVGRSEIASHSHSHGFWGYNDEGGSQVYVSSSGTSLGTSNVPIGSTSKEVFASLQVVKDLFGDTSSSLTFVTPGISSKVNNFTLTSDLTLKLKDAVVRVVSDTPVTVGGDGTVKTTAAAEIDLQSVTAMLPAGSTVTTTLKDYGTVIPAGTVIKIVKMEKDGEEITKVTIPAGTTVKGTDDNLYQAYYDAIEAGVMIGSRLTSQRVYVASQFKDYENRCKLRAYMITASTNDTSVTEKWISHIDSALAKGGYASFCIHAITDSYDSTGEGGHKITKEQADILFAYTESLGDRVWVATQTDAMKYFFEWSTATVSASYKDGVISVSLTDEERDDLFDMPLTVKVNVPGTWKSATVGDKELVIRRNIDGTSYVYVDVAPETTVTVVGK